MMSEESLRKKILEIIHRFEDPEEKFPYPKFSEELKKVLGEEDESERLQQRIPAK